jgi:phosphoribosylamine--glycine ligase
MKDICAQYNIPTAKYKNFIEKTAAEAYLNKQPLPVVIKASGLAAGKGVTIATTLDEGLNAINDIFNDKFGSGCELVIEEFMDGEEASYFVFTDGKNYIPLSSAQDHKRIGDGDTGPNTGGMGAYSPAPVFTQAIQDQVNKEMIEPTLKAMRDLGTPYQGILYAGVMIKNNYAKLVEYNVRFGDPECQVLMLRLRSDIVELILGTIDGNIHEIHTDWNNNHVATVVMASNGYPGEYKKGTIIRSLDTTEDLANIEVFHAGTEFKNNEVLAVGGRVLSVTSSDRDLKSALENIYSAIDTIDWTESTYRKDIGWRAIENG